MAEETKNQELTPQQAINILVQAVQLGQKAGCYSLDDAAVIKTAVDVFVKPQEEAKDEGTTPETDIKAAEVVEVEEDTKEG